MVDEHLALRKALKFYFYFSSSRKKPSDFIFQKSCLVKNRLGRREKWSKFGSKIKQINNSRTYYGVFWFFVLFCFVLFYQISGNGNVQAWLALYVFG